MNSEMSKILPVICLAFCFVACMGIMPAEAKDTNNKVTFGKDEIPEFIEHVYRLHNTELQVREFYKDKAKLESIGRETLQSLKDKPVSEGHPAEQSFKAYKMRLLLLLGDKDRAEILARELVSTEAWVPESIMVLGDIGAIKKDLKMEFLADLLPLSHWRRFADRAKNRDAKALRRGSGLPIIPNNLFVSVKKPDIAKLWEDHGFFHKASLSYREAIYARYMIDSLNLSSAQLNKEGWLGVDVANLWLSAAECDWLASRHTEAFEALAKGMIFGNENHFAQGKEIAERFMKYMEGNKQVGEKSDLSEETVKKLVQQISLAYSGNMNAHPRALMLLDEYGEEFGEELSTLKRNIKEKWDSLVERYIWLHRVQEKQIYLYGHNVYPENKRFNVIIPHPLDKEVLDKIVKTLKHGE